MLGNTEKSNNCQIGKYGKDTHTETQILTSMCVCLCVCVGGCGFWVISYILVHFCVLCQLCLPLVSTGKEKSGAKTVMIWGPVWCQEYCGCLTNSRCVELCNCYSGLLLQSSNPSPFSDITDPDLWGSCYQERLLGGGV